MPQMRKASSALVKPLLSDPADVDLYLANRPAAHTDPSMPLEADDFLPVEKRPLQTQPQKQQQQQQRRQQQQQQLPRHHWDPNLKLPFDDDDPDDPLFEPSALTKQLSSPIRREVHGDSTPLFDSDGKRKARRARSGSPLNRRRGGPLQHRTPSKNHMASFAVGSNPAFEMNSYQYRQHTYCTNEGCGKPLDHPEDKPSLGLCRACYDLQDKVCSACHDTLTVKQFLVGSSLCRTCYKMAPKSCKNCNQSLVNEQLGWETGLCNRCSQENLNCTYCSGKVSQLRYGTGLCDQCYNVAPKWCRLCDGKISTEELQYSSGMCNTCYELRGKSCKQCGNALHPGHTHWRSRICDTCFASAEMICETCYSPVDESSQKHWALTHNCDNCFNARKNGRCKKCQKEVLSTEAKYDTGLCNECYDKLQKNCLVCKEPMSLSSLCWGSSLCNKCYEKCEKKCKPCGRRIPVDELRWGSMLCDACYKNCSRTCRDCQGTIGLGELHWGTGMCNFCWDNKLRQEAPRKLGKGVWAVILAQFVFYAAPGMLQPALYLQVEAAQYPPSPAAAFAAVLTAASFAAMVAPVPLGIWADRKGEREVYCGVSIFGLVGSLAFLASQVIPVVGFALAWAAVNLPPAIRGVRGAYFAKTVEPEELSRVGNLASCAGLFGGFMGPLTSVAVNKVVGSEADYDDWFNAFTASASISLGLFVVCLVGLAVTLDAPKKKNSDSNRSFAYDQKSKENRICERCDRELSPEEMTLLQPLCDKCFRRRCERCNRPFSNEELEKQLENQTALCDGCWDNFGGPDKSWKKFRLEVLVSFCVLSMLLELGMNAAVIATFQPLAVGHFRWGNNAIAAVNFMGAGLSVVISLTMAYLRLAERVQMALAASLYFFGVLLYVMPPLSEWRLVVGLMLGIKAQILFMAPFTAIFSRLIGGMRVTNNLSTCLCLAPAIGAAIGTCLAPAFVRVAGTPSSLLAVVPSALGLGFIIVRWQWLNQGNEQRRPT